MALRETGSVYPSGAAWKNPIGTITSARSRKQRARGTGNPSQVVKEDDIEVRCLVL